jgi:hypothetical protein
MSNLVKFPGRGVGRGLPPFPFHSIKGRIGEAEAPETMARIGEHFIAQGYPEEEACAKAHDIVAQQLDQIGGI